MTTANGFLQKAKKTMNEQKEDVSPKKIERTDGIEEGIHFFNSAMRALDRIEGLLSQIEKTRALVKQLYKDYSGGENIAEETRTTAAQEKNKRERRREEKSAQSDRGSCPTRY